MRTVAIIGAGPSGLAAARWLAKEGFEPELFEQGDRLGGQWTGDPRYSGVWPSMHTNTSRIMTSFSDLPHSPGTPVYPSNQAVGAYLRRYAEKFDLIKRIRTATRVDEVSRDPSNRWWTVRSTGSDGTRQEKAYSKVVVAVGRYRRPMTPDVPGLETFAGTGGVAHTFEYKNPERYRGLRVLVAGCSISSLEIASDLAMLGADRVVSTNRRQRYVLQKIMAGVPVEHVAFTRFAALASESQPPDAASQGIREFIQRTCGTPDQYGAPKPSDNVFEAGITQCQHYLPMVAEGRIAVKPWISSVDGHIVRFADGSQEQIDAILFGTGYALDFSFLSEELRRALAVDEKRVGLYKYTFRPDLPGLAILGAVNVVGPHFPVFELEARWIAYAWSGTRPAPDQEEMEAALARDRARDGAPPDLLMHQAALMFAREAGVDPNLADWPQLARALFFGPLSPASFRLGGPDSLPDAPRRVAEDAAAFGAVPSPELTPEQCEMLRALAATRQDAAFSLLVDRLTPPESRSSVAA